MMHVRLISNLPQNVSWAGRVSQSFVSKTLAEQNRIRKDTDWLELFAKVKGGGEPYSLPSQKAV